MRFWTFALASFGLTGTLLTLIGLGEPLCGGLSAGMGLGIGWVAAWIFHRLKKGIVSAQTTLRGLAGTEAQALLPISASTPGKIRLLVDGQEIDLLARTRDAAPIPQRARVLVVGVEEGVAEVTHLRQLPDSSA